MADPKQSTSSIFQRMVGTKSKTDTNPARQQNFLLAQKVCKEAKLNDFDDNGLLKYCVDIKNRLEEKLKDLALETHLRFSKEFIRKLLGLNEQDAERIVPRGGLIREIDPKTGQAHWFAIYKTCDESIENRYQSHVLGKGSFGKVKLLQDLITGRLKVLKVLENKKNIAPSKFEKEVADEARLVNLFGHGGSGQVIAKRNKKGEISDKLYIRENLLSGREVWSELYQSTKGNKLDDKHKFNITRGALEGILSIHQKGYLHRDIKVENMVYDRVTGQLQVCDFGLATTINNPDTSRLVGTFAMLPPELIWSHGPFPYNTQGEVYALGQVLGEVFDLAFNIRADHLPGGRYLYVSPDFKSKIDNNPGYIELDALRQAMTDYNPQARPSMKTSLGMIQLIEMIAFNKPIEERLAVFKALMEENPQFFTEAKTILKRMGDKSLKNFEAIHDRHLEVSGPQVSAIDPWEKAQKEIGNILAEEQTKANQTPVKKVLSELFQLFSKDNRLVLRQAGLPLSQEDLALFGIHQATYLDPAKINAVMPMELPKQYISYFTEGFLKKIQEKPNSSQELISFSSALSGKLKQLDEAISKSAQVKAPTRPAPKPTIAHKPSSAGLNDVTFRVDRRKMAGQTVETLADIIDKLSVFLTQKGKVRDLRYEIALYLKYELTQHQDRISQTLTDPQITQVALTEVLRTTLSKIDDSFNNAIHKFNRDVRKDPDVDKLISRGLVSRVTKAIGSKTSLADILSSYQTNPFAKELLEPKAQPAEPIIPKQGRNR